MTSASTSVKPDAAPREDGVLDVSWATMIVALAVLLLVIGGVFFHLFRAQVLYALAEPSDWGHTLIVPVIVGWLIWRDRESLAKLQPFRPAWTGLLLVSLGLTFYVVSLVGPSWFTVHHNARQLGFAVTLFGIALVLFGWKSMKVLAFPLAYLVVFGFTYTDRIISYFTYKLQDISAAGGYLLLKLLNLDVDKSGNTITVVNDLGVESALNIAEACSGMRMLVAFMALGTLMAYVGLSAWWQRITLILLGIPVAVFVNVLRVATLGVLSLWDVGFAGGEFHSFVGFVWLVPAFLVFLGIMTLIQHVIVEKPETETESKEATA